MVAFVQNIEEIQADSSFLLLIERTEFSLVLIISRISNMRKELFSIHSQQSGRGLICVAF